MEALKRFVDAQENDSSEDLMEGRFSLNQNYGYSDALEEIRNGRKRGHWIWYIFPQLKGLGYSYNSNYYGITDAAEAVAYLKHPILGPRLIEISEVLLGLPEGTTARSVFGSIDAMKVKSSMTLFYMVSKEPIFLHIINRYYDGEMDVNTIKMLSI